MAGIQSSVGTLQTHGGRSSGRPACGGEPPHPVAPCKSKIYAVSEGSVGFPAAVHAGRRGVGRNAREGVANGGTAGAGGSEGSAAGAAYTRWHEAMRELDQAYATAGPN